MNKTNAILCADLHIRDDQPICRTDNYFEAQENKLRFLFKTAIDSDSIIICAGDFFHKAKSSKQLEIFIINLIKEYGVKIYTIPGNHDLPYHNLEKLSDSSLGILEAAGVIDVNKTHLEKTCVMCNETKYTTRRIVISHKYIDEYFINTQFNFYFNYEFDVFLYGDNHQTIYFIERNHTLVNPGSMMRMTADQIDHKPCFFVYYIPSNKTVKMFFPIEEGVVTREHIDIVEKNNEKMMAYVDRMDYTNWSLTFNFKNNIKNYLINNKVKKSVEEIIWRYIDE